MWNLRGKFWRNLDSKIFFLKDYDNVLHSIICLSMEIEFLRIDSA